MNFSSESFQERADTILTALEVAPEPLRSFANILVEVCAYAGTGNVLKIQQLLHICSEPPKEEEEDKKEGQCLSLVFSILQYES